MTPQVRIINGDTCGCFCGEQFKIVTYYKLNSEGCDSLKLLQRQSIYNLKEGLTKEEKENKRLKDDNEKLTKKNKILSKFSLGSVIAFVSLIVANIIK